MKGGNKKMSEGIKENMDNIRKEVDESLGIQSNSFVRDNPAPSSNKEEKTKSKLIVHTFIGIVGGIFFSGFGVPLMNNIKDSWIFYILMPLVFGSTMFILEYSKIKGENQKSCPKW
jgi:hypothetical protein